MICLGVFSFPSGVYGAGKHRPKITPKIGSDKQTQIEDGSIQSRITFYDEKTPPRIHFADIATADPLQSCPLEPSHNELSVVLKQFLSNIRVAVESAKKAQSEHCSALGQRFQSSQSQVSDAIRYQAIAAGSISGTQQQDRINAQTQQAMALNQLLLTTTDLLQTSCISSITDKATIQKLVSQIVTISGLFVGGWQGIGIAAAGQIIGNIPLFTNDIDSALGLFQKYDERSARESFLCFYRQMRKTSCLLFSGQENKTIGGIDTTLNTGSPQLTAESVENYRNSAETAALFKDIIFLKELKTSSEKFFELMENSETRGKSQAFSELLRWCEKFDPNSQLSPNPIHSISHHKGIQTLNEVCDTANSGSYFIFTQSDYEEFIQKAYFNILALTKHYDAILRSSDKVSGKIAATWESLEYFKGLQKNMSEYQSETDGSQTRLNFLHLTGRLGKGIAANSFKKMMKRNHNDLLRNFQKITDTPVPGNQRVRQKALSAMIDLCQTLDPTLTCMAVQNPLKDSLFIQWKNFCVGPTSPLCREVIKKNEIDLLIRDQKYKTYFNSLCGI